MAYSPGMSADTDIQIQLEGLRHGRRPLPAFIGMAGALAVSRADQLAMVQGLKYYQNHSFRRPDIDRSVIWQSGAATLRHVPSMGKRHLLLVPSMINRSVILDLLPERSFAGWLAAQGIDVYILDWGEPTQDDEQQNLDDVLNQKLLPCLSFLNEKTGQYDALGYCMGGTLLAGAAHLNPPGLDKVVYLASPWDFHAGNRQLQQQVLLGTPSALQMTEGGRVLPSSWIQSVFAAVNAERNIHKFRDFAALDQTGDQARMFVAVEDWLNDGVDLPGDLARACLVDWYGQNKPARGEWLLSGSAVDPSTGKHPVLVFTSSTDRLVPEESSHALADRIGGACKMTTLCGHIGMMTSQRAETEVWKPLFSWLSAKT